MSYFSDCECNMDGSVDNSCDINTGKCTCKPNVSGDKCDESTEGYFGFPGEPQGMIYIKFFISKISVVYVSSKV